MTSHAAALKALDTAHDTVTLLRAVSSALDLGLADAVEARLTPLVGASTADPRLWQFLGLARRELQDSAGAHQAFNQAAALAPADPIIAHSQARTALEAGYPALAMFNRARLLAPADGAVMLGRVAAMMAEGKGAEALDQLGKLLGSSPGWTDGHHAYARLAAQVGQGAPLDAPLRRAIGQHPQAGALWQTLIQLWMEARDYHSTAKIVGEARAALGPSAELDRIEAICLSELGEPGRAQAIFDSLPFPDDGEAAIWPIRNFIRLGRYDQAGLLADQHFAANDAAIWPYRSLLWRLNADVRWQWLEGDERMIQTFDIASEVGSLARLAEVLRGLHTAKGEPLDQSVRGGTQTDGNLLARAEPEIRQLRAALLEAVRSYVAALPAADPTHPMLLARREPLRIAGSWSVRLTDRGFHADHVHWQGWVSSAFYVVVPPDDPAVPESGWLAFGECRDLLPDLRAFRTVKPAPGTLALFPSIMWHGTRPFGSGERMTVAYDIARPPQA